MKKTLINLIFRITLLGIVTESHAAWTQKTKIKELRGQANGMYVKLENFTYTDPNINCQNTGFWLPDTAQNYKVRSSMLLAAFVTKRDINISYYSCDGLYHAIVTVALVP